MFGGNKAETMRSWVAAISKFDVETAFTYCTDDIEWLTPHGHFKGKSGMENYINWLKDNVQDFKNVESGHGIMVEGDRAFFEHTMSGIMQGEQVEFLAICTYEFEGEKISRLKTVFDRLSIADQATNQWLPKKLVNTIINQMEKGLH